MRYAKIRHLDIANGEGVRTSLFVSGCDFHCPGCFNQKLQDFNYGEVYTLNTENEILEATGDSISAGLSILGGDPLCQPAEDILELIRLCRAVHAQGKTVWLWSGYTWEQVFSSSDTELDVLRQELIRNVDIFVDGTYQEKEADRFLLWRGSANQRTIDVKASILNNEISVL